MSERSGETTTPLTSADLQRLQNTFPCTIVWKMKDGVLAVDEGMSCAPAIPEFFEESKKFAFRSGEGMPGRVWESRSIEFIGNAQLLGESLYKRVDIAKQYNIRTTIGIYKDEAIYEFTTTEELSSFWGEPWFLASHDGTCFAEDYTGRETEVEEELGWRIRNTFLEFSGTEHGPAESSMKRSNSESALVASKDAGFVTCLSAEESQTVGSPVCAEATPEAAAREPDLGSIGQVKSVMLRNIGCRLSQEDIACVLDTEGFHDTYDWIYTPRDSKARRVSNLGYAFIHFKTAEFAQRCHDVFDGRVFGDGRSRKSCEVVPAIMQGQIYAPKKARSHPLRVAEKSPHR